MDDSIERPARRRYVAPMKWLASRRTCIRSRMALKRNASGMFVQAFRGPGHRGRCLLWPLASHVEPVRHRTTGISLGIEVAMASSARDSVPTEIDYNPVARTLRPSNREVHDYD